MSPAHPTIPARRRVLRWALAALAGPTLAGCGFQLRGARPLPFASLHLGLSTQSGLGERLRRLIEASGQTRIETDPAAAQARFIVMHYEREKEVLSLTGAGKVREYRLHTRLQFRVLDKAGKELLGPASLALSRSLTWDDVALLAKEAEEGLLFEDMDNDLAQQVLRRLAAARQD